MCNEYKICIYDGMERCIIANTIFAYNKADAVMKFLAENSHCWFDLNRIEVTCVVTPRYDYFN